MSILEKLQSAKNLTDLATLLGFTPKGASYVLYKLHSSEKYRTFDIPKKSGGTRTINAPEKSLSLLQKRLGGLLYECVAELQKNNPGFWRASHGFQKKRTIISNAEMHKRRRFVFNVDIEDFFGTLNFGRVRGFFIHDNNFALDPTIATIIAQIACHDNALPQGSPCSPVISNLIGNILDSRLLALARDTRCTYTRYADDLTFSTNEIFFPTEVAVNVQGSEWIVGKRLNKRIERTGFKLNEGKTRMSLHRSRQTVTGLVVNSKANINIDYYRTVRSMCHSLFRTGLYYKKTEAAPVSIDNLNPLEGMLSHIYFVKARRDRIPKVNQLAVKAREFESPHAPGDLYRKFLLYKHFVAPTAPVIVTEGITDIAYLKCAIRSLANAHPSLAKEKDGKITHSVNFLRPSRTTRDVLNLGQGASGQASLVSQYSNILKKYAHKPMQHPVIILCDNDSGPSNVFKNAANKCGKTISKATTDPFYYLGENLYLIKVPEVTPSADRDIEDLFQPALLATVIDGKPFNKKKDHCDEKAYGKVVFAEKVVRANATTVDFSNFADLLSRIDQCLTHYKTVMPAGAPAASTGTATP